MTHEEGPERRLLHSVAALERTALAWERTAVSLGAVGLLLLKVVDGGRLTQAAGLALVAVAAAVVLVVVPFGYRRARARVDPESLERPFVDEDRWRARALVGTAWLVSLVAVAVAVDIWVAGAV
ncbi:DUF202 domain-containing protein [Nocardioides sediminis]|uniref:DUF202 domain-containing protein n=1 Tax=Nocardioides sediminis TaxID=433648 RepID=UPI0018FF18B9|nr:DUF202 domain-containing protein [Nocardioides sediminis]